MRYTVAIGSGLLLVLLLGASTALAANDPLTVNAPNRAYAGTDYDASVAVHGITEGVVLDIIVTPALDAASITPSGACAEAPGGWKCTLSAADGASQVFSIQGDVPSAAVGGGLQLDATLTPSAGDAVSASDKTRVMPRAALGLALNGGGEVPVGESTTLTAMFNNLGPSMTPAVLVVTAPAAEIDIGAPAGAGCVAIAEAGRTGQRCEMNLDVSDFRSLDFTVTTLDGKDLPETRVVNAVLFPVGSIAGHERVYYSTLDKRLHDNSGAIVLTVPAPKTEEEKPTETPTDTGKPNDTPQGTPSNEEGKPVVDEKKEPVKDGKPSLATSITGPADLVIGSEAAYTLVVSNSGNGTSKGFDTRTVLTGVGRIVSVSSADAACSASGNQVSCIYSGLKPGKTATAVITTTSQKAGDMKLVATGGGDAAAQVATTVKAADIDLAFVTFSASPSTVKSGAPVTISIGVQNLGDAPARTVLLNIPAGGIDLGDMTVGPCVKSGANIRCFLGSIGAGETRTVSLTIDAGEPGGYSANGVVSHAGKDPNSSNDGRTLSVTVEP